MGNNMALYAWMTLV